MAKSKDPIFAARKVLDQIIAKYDPQAVSPNVGSAQLKDPKAQVAGRLGGLKGGKARALKLSSVKRKKIAKKAASVPGKNVIRTRTRYQAFPLAGRC